jgi:hephaestin
MMPRFARWLYTLIAGALLMGLGGWLAVRQENRAGPVPQTRTYYIAAEDTVWDYAPAGADLMMGGHAIDSVEFAISNGPKTQARVFRKAVYREYTDSTFRTRKPRGNEWAHLGLLGPVLRAQVGDTMRVVFRNRAAYPFSMHPHGVFYTKRNEGALYSDESGEKDKLDDGVAPGQTYTYTWLVPERAGPGPVDPSSILWPYHSHTHEWRDVNAGLIGGIIVTRRGATRADGTPRDVDREFVVLFGVFNEMESRYTPENLRTYTGDTLRAGPKGDYAFSGVGYQTINGYMFGNLPLESINVAVGERVRWYTFAGTTADDFHAVHWHGGTVLAGGQRADVVNLAVPLVAVTSDMVADVPGVWMLHCHVAEHMQAGMSARFRIREKTLAAN